MDKLSQVKDLIFATGNAHKLKEVRAILPESMNILSLKDVSYTQEIPEPYETIEENAVHKARVIYEYYGKNCFAEDTGLEVEALDGAPGVYSARYAGEDCIAEDNVKLLLHNLTEKSNRKARFKTVSALFWEGKLYTFQGIKTGVITSERSGNQGFGYDPIFIPDGHTQTYAQMDIELKNKISHRSLSISKLCNFIKENC